MNQPWIYMYSPSQSPLPPHSLPNPSDFHVSLNISGLGPGAGAEDKRLQEGTVVTPCPFLEGQVYTETRGCRPPQGMGTEPRWEPRASSPQPSAEQLLACGSAKKECLLGPKEVEMGFSI